MKIAIIGAGAIGCLFACLLDNYEVTLYDVSPVAVECINRDGILLQEPDGTESRHRIPIALQRRGTGTAGSCHPVRQGYGGRSCAAR